MLKKLWSRLKAHLSEEVPEAMDACVDCGVAQCRDERFLACPHRLAQAAALKAYREAAEKTVRGAAP